MGVVRERRTGQQERASGGGRKKGEMDGDRGGRGRVSSSTIRFFFRGMREREGECGDHSEKEKWKEEYNALC